MAGNKERRGMSSVVSETPENLPSAPKSGDLDTRCAHPPLTAQEHDAALNCVVSTHEVDSSSEPHNQPRRRAGGLRLRVLRRRSRECLALDEDKLWYNSDLRVSDRRRKHVSGPQLERGTEGTEACGGDG